MHKVKERERFVAAHGDAAVIQIYGNEDWTWEIAKELLRIPEFYCISTNDLSEINDEKVEEAEEIIAYIERGNAQIKQQSIQMILDSNEKISGYEKCFETMFYDIYLFQ